MSFLLCSPSPSPYRPLPPPISLFLPLSPSPSPFLPPSFSPFLSPLLSLFLPPSPFLSLPLPHTPSLWAHLCRRRVNLEDLLATFDLPYADLAGELWGRGRGAEVLQGEGTLQRMVVPAPHLGERELLPEEIM